MRWKIALLSCVLMTGIAGCEDPPEPKPDNPDAGPQTQVTDPNIANAVASAAGADDSLAPSDEGPPPNGVFAPGEADKRVPPNQVPKVDVVDKGSDPKSKWLPLAPLTEPQLFDLSVFRVEGQGGIAVKFTIAASLPKAPTKEGEKPPEEEEAPKALTAPAAIHFVIKKVAVHEQLAQAPKSDVDALMKRLATLTGSRIAAVLLPNGLLTKETFELAKDADPGAADAVRAVIDVLGMFFSPHGNDAVGQGSFSIVGDRSVMGGLDLVRYRVTKIEEQTADEAKMSVEVRSYAASPSTLPKGAPAGATAVMVQSQGKVVMTRKRGAILPVRGNVQSRIDLQYLTDPAAQTGQAMRMQHVAEWTPHETKEEKKAP